MAPRAQRTAPPYIQITEHFKERILAGELTDGDRLPPIAELAQEWGVATATASKAITQLQTAGLVRTSPQGTFVTTEHTAHSAQNRAKAVRRTGLIYPPAERSQILSAEIVEAPAHVAGFLGIDAGDDVLRRERVTLRNGRPIEVSTSWLPAEFITEIPELASTDRIPGGTIGRIAEVLGRHIREGQDTYRATTADTRVAELLSISKGAPVLVGRNLWCDEHGVIEFGESFRPQEQEVGMTYQLQQDD